MKNDILKISGVSFSKCAYFWPACWVFGGFPGNFKRFNERMQKESLRGCGKDHFGYSPKPIVETADNDENDDFSNFNFESRFEPGGVSGIIKKHSWDQKMTRRAYFIGSIE